jgi:uncharacterized membrane protein (UPF0136 family)
MNDEQAHAVNGSVRRSSFIVHRSILALLALVITALAVGSMRLDSATGDEGAHISAGMIKLRHGWLSFFPEQPPVMNVLSALPLAGFNLPDVWKRDTRLGSHWRTGYTLLYRSGNDAHRLLFLARLPTIALFLALCFAVYWVVSSEVGGTWGLVAFALTGFCPNLMAHGRLATVDLAVTAFAFLSFAFLLRALRTRGWIPSALCGVFAMCALLSKVSGVLVPPFLLLAAALHVRMHNDGKALLKPIAAALIAGVVTLYAVTFSLASEQYLQTAYRDTPRIAVPWLQYRMHVRAIQYWYAQGHSFTQFLLGEFSTDGWPHYYYVAYLLKTPVGGILLFILAIVAARRKRSVAQDASLLFIGLFFAVSMTSHIDLGLRYVLPVYPFIYTATAISLAGVVTERRRAIGVGVLVAWHCVSSLLAYPGYIAYFNELIGSHRNADKFLMDSNLDWGQDLRRLRIWCDQNGVDFIRIDYFGGGEPSYEFGKRAERYPGPRLLPKGWFALSRHFYRSSFEPASKVDYDTILAASKARYVTTINGSIDVYRVD